ncbi:MAG: carboxypeptidase-like regulatory domain-containing protein, partial [Planctomycetes bacterium]|nr:carboxypeptidase-like regulatory domain-containing protein [Planctomycetota bacterium]
DAVLPPGGAIAGRVTDPDGLPIPDAWVHVPRIPELEQDWPGIRNVEAGGRFLIPGLPDGEHDLCAGAPGFLPAREPRLRVHGTETVEVAIRLVPGGTISGRVVDESARPIAGAVLEPEMPHDTPASPGIPSAVWAFALRRTPPAETATDGTFTLRGLLGDPAAILVSVPGSREQRFAAVPRGTTDHLLQFLRDGSLSGIVVDAETGRPPGSLDVRLDQGSVWFEPETGRLTGKWIPPGRRTLAVNAGGYLPVRSEIEVEPGRETEDVIVRLSPGQRLRVAVRRATDGAPVPDAAVRAESEGGSAAADTGEDGCCELRGLPAGPCDLTVTAVGLAPAEVSDVDVPAAEALRVVLSPGGTITGTAFDAEGKPLGDVRVDLARFAGDWVRWTVRTDADGRFRFELLTPRRYVVSLRESGSSTVMEEVEVADGAEVDIALHNGEQEGRVRFNGRLLLRGVPQPDRWFRVSSPEPGSSTAQGRTDDEGRFALAGLVPGRYRLWSDVDVPVDLRGGGTIERDIELPAGRLRGRVTAADRCTPVEGASVSLTSGDGLAACTARTDAGGWFAIGPARPGTVRLVATADGYAPQVLEGVEVTEEGGEVSVALSRGFSVTLVVTGTDGRPVRRAWAYIPNLPVCFHWPIGADGRGEARLPPGRHTIRVTARGCAPAVLDLAIGGDVEVPVALTAGGSLVVKVVDGDRPATGAHVRLAETDHETSWVPAGADGTVRFEHLAAGAVRIEAAGAAGLAVEAEAKIEEGAEAAVTLTLGRR